MIKIKKVKTAERKPEDYKFQLEINGKEAIEFIKEIGEFKQGEPRVNHSATSKVFMVLSDTLQDLELIPMTPNRKKGDDSYPRLSNDNVWVTQKSSEVKG